MNAWNKFWQWYENKILGSVILIAVIQFIQIPHMVWNADIMLEAGIVSRVHPVIDWFLYGVDLIEIVSIINVGMIMFSLIKKRSQKKPDQNKVKLISGCRYYHTTAAAVLSPKLRAAGTESQCLPYPEHFLSPLT